MPKFVFLPPQRRQAAPGRTRLLEKFPRFASPHPSRRRTHSARSPTPKPRSARSRPTCLRGGERLKWLQAPAIAPPAGYYSPELVAHPVVVTNFRGIFNEHIAAHIMAFVLAFARGFHRYFPQQVEHEWAPAPLDTGVVHLPESTALIVGVGGIGAETARLCAAFGMRVIGIDARRDDQPRGRRRAASAGGARRAAAARRLRHPDHPAHARDGRADERRALRAMKPTAFFINIGRGMTTRLDDLVAALRARQIAGAGLDVFEKEPLPADHPLWDAPNALLTPHTAGFGPYLDDRRLEIIVDNARRFVRGEPLRNVVDKALWF